MDELKFLQYLAKFDQQIGRIYNQFIQELANIGVSVTDALDSGIFSFANFPQIQERVSKAMQSYNATMKNMLVSGMKTAIDASFTNTTLVLGKYSVLEDKAVESVRETCKTAYIASRMKPDTGLSLSQRVWNYTQQAKAEFEMGVSDIMTDGIVRGISAEELGRRVRGLLQNPDAMYRRYHLKKIMADGTKKDVVEWRKRTIDEDGKVHFMSTDIEHPGSGVYRSSRKNALRMAATEINMAYRYADCMRWQSEPFVLGIRIRLSANHTCNGKPFVDMCDDLIGDYPKWFLWRGWHIKCRCSASSILVDEEEFEQYMALPKAQRKNYVSPNLIKDMPDNYYKYIETNRDRIERSIERGTQPLWIRDNYVDGDINNKFNWLANTQKTEEELRRERIEEAAQIRHAKRDAKAIQEAWDNRKMMDNEQRREYHLINMLADKYNEPRYSYRELLGNYGDGTAYLRVRQLSENVGNEVRVYRRYIRQIYDIDITGLGARTNIVLREFEQIKNDLPLQFMRGKADKVVKYAENIVKNAVQERIAVQQAWDKRRQANVVSEGLLNRIAEAKSLDELNYILYKNKVTTKFELPSLRLKEQKIAAEYAVRMKSRYNLDAIEISEYYSDGSDMMHAHGRRIQVNTKNWAADVIEKQKNEVYNNNVTGWTAYINKEIEKVKRYITDWEKYIGDMRYDQKAIDEQVKEWRKTVDDYQKMLDSGMKRHNVLLSADTAFRDSLIHEYGHVVHDQLYGGVNDWFMLNRYSQSAALTMNDELKKLYRKHKKTGTGWLSQYGRKNWKEFLSECNVLYINSPEKLPADVRHWFDLTVKYARTASGPTDKELPSKVFRGKIKTSQNEVAKLTPEQKDEIYSRPLKEQYTATYKGKKGVVNTHLTYDGNSDDVLRVRDVAHAFADTFGDCMINAEVNKVCTQARRKIYPEFSDDVFANPDLRTPFGLVDVKSPSSLNKIVRNCNSASSKQHSIVCLTTHRLHLTEQQIEFYVNNVWNNREYTHDIIFVYNNGTLTKYNRPL